MLTSLQIKKVKKQLLNNSRLPLIFGALADASRFQIVRLFIKHKGLCVTDVARILNVTVPAASQQLKVLEMSGIVEKERMGQEVCYTIKENDRTVKEVLKLIKN